MRKPEKRKITIKDVAREAGVVPSTVSHVIHGTASISEETKRRVNEVIERLGYSPNASARALRSNRSGLIGVVVPDISCEFYARCASFIMKEAQKDGYTVLLSDAFFQSGDGQSGIRALVEHCVDGFIFIGGNHDRQIIEYVSGKNIPIVFGDRKYEDYASVNFDNRTVISRMIEAFYHIGYRSFAYLGEPTEVQSNLIERFRGYEKGVSKFSDIKSRIVLESMCIKYHNHHNAGHDIFKQKFIDEGYIPEVIFATTDMLAQGIISAARENGIEVPEQTAVVGFNDMSVSEYFTPPLTTVRQSTEDMGKSCYRLLREILVENNRSPSSIVLTQDAVIRESAVIPEDVRKKFGL